MLRLAPRRTPRFSKFHIPVRNFINHINMEKPEKTIPPTEADPSKPKKMSKKQLNKIKRKKKKEEAKRKAREAREAANKEEDTTEEFEIPKVEKREGKRFGDLGTIQSQMVEDLVYVDLKHITKEHENKTIWVRTRMQNSRITGKLAFLVLRQRMSSMQAVASVSETTCVDMIRFLKTISKESIVDIKGVVTAVEKPVEGCSISEYELQIVDVFCLSRSRPVLPFQIEDATRRLTAEETAEMDNEEIPVKEGEEKKTTSGAIVGLHTRLNNRVLDLRTRTNQAIFKVQAAVCTLYREFLNSKGFTEIHSPKLLGGSSEGGTNVFELEYFGRKACLAQSPQLFKQMMIMADFERVFEIGPVFRAEKHHTHRHLCEFTGLDGEMEIKQHYMEVMEMIGDLFKYMFQGLETRWAVELGVVNDQYPFEPFQFAEKTVMITFEEGVALLKENGIEWDVMEDLDTPTERKLGGFVKEKYKTDFYILHRYPETARPFYTMLAKDDPNFTCSYDVFMRGEEIISGAQRIHEPELLSKRATEKGLDVETIKDYIDSFSYGAYPHGGWGVGMERVVMLYLNSGNIRRCTAFPRDPKRLSP